MMNASSEEAKCLRRNGEGCWKLETMIQPRKLTTLKCVKW
jgi:hypothetical protein